MRQFNNSKNKFHSFEDKLNLNIEYYETFKMPNL